jgi:hypothetical protein
MDAYKRGDEVSIKYYEKDSNEKEDHYDSVYE